MSGLDRLPERIARRLRWELGRALRWWKEHRAPAAPDYQQRVEQELADFQDCLNVHDLPDIFHYWSNKYLASDMARFGFTSPDTFFLEYIRRVLAGRAPSVTRVLSIGAGNCDLELKLARQLVEAGHTGFVFECLDINPDMLRRGREDARQAGLESKLGFIEGDFNDWRPGHEYDAVLANQSLHHVLNLEGLFDGIAQSLGTGGYFLVSDMIGRNGHMRWPEAVERLLPFWQELPSSYRYNRVLGRQEDEFINHDCSEFSFEGIRAQDILPLLLERFRFEFFYPFGNIIFPFVDRSFGANFDAAAAWDRDFIDRVHAADEQGMISGELTPTQMLAALTIDERPLTTRHPALTPEHCVRGPGEDRCRISPAA